MHPTVSYLARLALHAHALYPPPDVIRLGTITLLPHQVAAVHWLQHRITRFGGALLADPPGLGKTYVALAIAKLRGVRPLVIAPAALRPRWHAAASAAAVPLDFVSTERLSAAIEPHLGRPAFIVIDEAHHLRSASTRRYQRTAALCSRARVLLLTATPIHNRPEDLERLTALFHLPPGRPSIAALRRLTLRRSIEQIHAAGMAEGGDLHIPAVVHHGRLDMPDRSHAITRAITRLPPITESDREGHALLTVGLLHALQSSDAACRSRIRRRIASTIAIEEAARAQVLATPALRRAWCVGDDAIQLAMPQLLGTSAPQTDPALPAKAERQRLAMERILPLLDGTGDHRRAVALRRMARWCNRPVVAFTQFTATASTLYARLQSVPGVALLCGDEARIASGVLSRADVLTRLLSPDRSRHSAVRLLITTDVLSEGLSLSGVATIVHLDLPWTAARLDQRVGRAARIAAPVAAVRVVELPARLPAGADVHLRTLLRRKRRYMQAFEHRADDTLQRIAVARELANIASAAKPPAAAARCITVYSSEMSGECERVIALVRLQGRRQLVAISDGHLRPTDSADWRALRSAERWEDGCASRERFSLRETLQEYVDEEELRRMLETAGDTRLVTRREADHRLLDGSLQQRLALAPRVTSARHDLMHRTSPRRVRGIAALLLDFEGKLTLRESAEEAIGPSDARIAVYVCVVIRPA